MYLDEWIYIFKIIGLMFSGGMAIAFSYILLVLWKERYDIPRVP